MIELDFHVRRIVYEAKADFSNFGDCSDDLEASREDRTGITLRCLNQHSAHGRAGFRTVGSDRIEQTNPKRFASGHILAASKAWTGEGEKDEQTSERGKATYNKPQLGNRGALRVETVQALHCCCPVSVPILQIHSLSAWLTLGCNQNSQRRVFQSSPYPWPNLVFHENFSFDCTSTQLGESLRECGWVGTSLR